MLTPTQLTAINQHLRKENWLLNEDLISELTDHYINGISDRLAQGMAFEMALREIYTGFGGRKGLLKMEEEKSRHQSSLIARELRQLIGSYVQPPRLSLTILLIGFAYWATTTGLIGDRMGWIHSSIFCLSSIPIIALFVHNGYLYVAGRKQSMNDFRGVSYRYILAINLVNIPNFLWGNLTVKSINTYSAPYQIVIIFMYLFIWTVILDFVIVQPKRPNALIS